MLLASYGPRMSQVSLVLGVAAGDGVIGYIAWTWSEVSLYIPGPESEFRSQLA